MHLNCEILFFEYKKLYSVLFFSPVKKEPFPMSGNEEQIKAWMSTSTGLSLSVNGSSPVLLTTGSASSMATTDLYPLQNTYEDPVMPFDPKAVHDSDLEDDIDVTSENKKDPVGILKSMSSSHDGNSIPFFNVSEDRSSVNVISRSESRVSVLPPLVEKKQEEPRAVVIDSSVTEYFSSPTFSLLNSRNKSSTELGESIKRSTTLRIPVPDVNRRASITPLFNLSRRASTVSSDHMNTSGNIELEAMFTSQSRRDISGTINNFGYEATRSIIADVGGVESARMVMHAKSMRSRFDDPDSHWLKILFWQMYYWLLHIGRSACALYAVCFTLVCVSAFFLKYGMPTEYWYVSLMIDSVIAMIVCVWPFESIKYMLREDYGKALRSRMAIPSVIIAVVYITIGRLVIDVYAKEYSDLYRHFFILIYLVNVAICAYLVNRGNGVHRLGRYVFFTQTISFSIIPLYAFLIGPYLSVSTDTVGVIIVRFFVHPLLSDGIVTLVRTIAVVCQEAVSIELMYTMACMSQMMSSFYSRIILTGMHTDMDERIFVGVGAAVRLLGYIFVHERHKVSRLFFRVVVKSYRALTGLCKRKRKLPSKEEEGFVKGNVHDINKEEEEEEEDDNYSVGSDKSHSVTINADGTPVARSKLKRTISLSGLTYESSSEKERIEHIVPDMMFTSVLYELVAIPLVPFLFILYYNISFDVFLPTEEIWHAWKLIALQVSVSITVDIIGAIILEKRGIRVLRVPLRHGLVMFGIESSYFLHGFMMLLTILPFYTIWPSYVPHH